MALTTIYQDNIIETDDLTRCFGKKIAVDQVNLRVPVGSVYGLLGSDGAGKSTTIRMLLGLIRPSAGQVYLFRTPVTWQQRDILYRVGSLVESASLYAHLSGRENLELTRGILGISFASVKRALRMVDLEKDADRLVRSYSPSMRQRLALALALFRQPELLILDEPTSGLDPEGVLEIRDLIRRLPVDHGISVFFSSPLLAEVEQIATHAGVLRDGNLCFQGRIDDLQAQRSSLLKIGVDRPDIAVEALKREGWLASIQEGNRIYVNVNGQADAAIVNTQLVRNRLNVYELQVEQLTLEDIFLNLPQYEAV